MLNKLTLRKSIEEVVAQTRNTQPGVNTGAKGEKLFTLGTKHADGSFEVTCNIYDVTDPHHPFVETALATFARLGGTISLLEPKTFNSGTKPGYQIVATFTH